jgi:hypothetical protein
MVAAHSAFARSHWIKINFYQFTHSAISIYKTIIYHSTFLCKVLCVDKCVPTDTSTPPDSEPPASSELDEKGRYKITAAECRICEALSASE